MTACTNFVKDAYINTQIRFALNLYVYFANKIN